MDFLQKIKSPDHEFSPAAFWFWYGDLKPAELRRQIDMMVEQGVYNGFMHARAYLKTPYLGEDWWKAIDACIDESEKVGFYPWLYDEYAWPSGTAGSTFKYGSQAPSRTLAKGQCNMAKYLKIMRYPDAKAAMADMAEDVQYRVFVAAFCREDGQWKYVEDVSGAEGEIMVFFRQVFTRFVDYLNEDTIKEFIGYTHEEYKKRYSEHFGNRVPGIFFDEIFMTGRLPWTDRFAEEFEKRQGYDLIPLLYALAEPGGEAERKVRNDYYNITSELYEETFFGQISRWCDDNKLALTGHIEEFFYRQPGSQGQFFNNVRHMHIPGADCHDFRYRFPRKITYREPKFSVSVARAYGKKRMMSEAFGGAGWGCSLQEFKRGVNTLGAMGINMITLHGFYSECENQGTQADWPTSFFFQNPYWRYFSHFADYISRVCYMNTVGKPVVDVGIYYPIEDLQMETVAGMPSAKGFALDKAWNDAMGALIENQMDVDMIDKPSIMAGKICDGELNIGVQKFRVLLFPETTEPGAELRAKLDEFEKSGGHIIRYSCGDDVSEGLVRAEDLPAVVAGYIQPDVRVMRGATDNLYVNHRNIEGKDVYFVSNGSPESRNLDLLLRERGGIVKLSPENGEVTDVSYRITDKGTEVELKLNSDEACWLIVDGDMAENKAKEEALVQEIVVPSVWEFMPLDSQIKGEAQLKTAATELSIPLAVFSSELHPDGRQIRIQNTAWEKGRCGRHLSLWEAGWITRRPDWIDNAQKNLLCFRKEFTLSDAPENAKICIAAVNRWTMWINGQEVASSQKDRTPEVLDICSYLKKGDNLIAVKVENDTPMEHFNILSVDDIPVEEMISLLAQCEIVAGGQKITICTDTNWSAFDKLEEGWEQPGFAREVLSPRSVDALITCGECDDWLKTWQRGKLPLQPWGDLPLFGKLVSYPQKVCYSVTLPAGTKKIMYPSVSGSDIKVTIDGMERTWENGVCQIQKDGLPHQMQIAVTVNSADDGLLENIRVEVVPFSATLCDWRLHGLRWYSGFARYKTDIRIKKEPGRYVLNLGKAAYQAEVWVNGIHAGDRVWEPYSLDITDLLRDGDNELVVMISNSAAVERQFMLVDEGMGLGWNRYWNYDNIQREGQNLISGLIGPVKINRMR